MKTQDILTLIESRAKSLWGDRWLAELTRRYCDLAPSHGDTTATIVRRRPQITRIFDRQGCNADTLLILLEAVDCKIKIIAQEDITPVESN